MIVVYHNQCRDGFAAAWAIRSVYPDAKFVPGNYGRRPEGFPFTGEDVIFADFSLSRAEMFEIEAKSGSLTVFDHHKTAEEALRDFPCRPTSRVVFDMDRSGAGISWDEVTGGATRPWFINYVEDRDLWRFKLANSKPINAYLGSLKFDFAAWDELLRIYPSTALERGLLLVAKTDAYVEEVAKNAYHGKFQDGVPCMVVNAPQVDISELLAGLLEKTPAWFAAGWWLRSDGLYQVGLRSRASSDFDVSEIAKAHGGGGHRNAAGFQCKTLPAWVLPG